MKYEILIYSAGVSSFQLHVLLSLPSGGCRECSEITAPAQSPSCPAGKRCGGQGQEE